MTTITTRATKGTELTHNELDANFSRNAQAKVALYTVVEGDNTDTIECSGTFTVTLPDAAAIVAAADTGDFEVTVYNSGSGTITIGRTTGTDTINGTAANISLLPDESVTLKVNQAGNGYNVNANALPLLGITASVAELNIMDGVTASTAELNILDGVTSSTAELNILDGVTATATELNYIDVATPGTVEASKAVVVDANKDATGFRKITGSTSTGYTASFTYTGTTNDDYAVFGNITGLTGNTAAVYGKNSSATGKGVFGSAEHATGINYGGYFQTLSSAGYAGYFVATVAGGTPISAVAETTANSTHNIVAQKGASFISLNAKASAGSFNPIVQLNDTTLIADQGINTSVLTLAPYATDAVGIRIDSTVDTVTISGTTNITTITAPAVTAGATIIKRVIGGNPYPIAETSYPIATLYLTGEITPGYLYNLNLGHALATGTIRVYYTTNAITSTITGRILVNGGLGASFSNANGGVISTYSEISITAGDVICLQAYYTTAGTHTIYNISLGANAQIIAVA